ncbi:MAG: hypothetical protein OEV01_15510 [Nitrospira sp.]|nr:hypothetical protein [Nitrospira sp.]
MDAAIAIMGKLIACDLGCHGVNFGAKEPSAKNPNGGYYAYITSKFANRMIVLDYDPNGDGNVGDAEIAGAVVLTTDLPADRRDDAITGNKGMGGQGIMPVPNVYNGWVQKLPKTFCDKLKPEQRNPIGAPVNTCPES